MNNQMNYCLNEACGYKEESEAYFCPSCGSVMMQGEDENNVIDPKDGEYKNETHTKK